jgi:hypothetical protein
MKLQVMSNGFTPPMNHSGMPGKFRKTIFMGKRWEIEIHNPEIEQAIEEALDYGFKAEVWIERIIEESCQ